MTTPENRLTVLLADDDKDDLFLLRRALGKLETVERTVGLPDGEQACAYLKGEGEFADRKMYPFPDVLILDQRLPRLTGLDVLHWLRREPMFDRLPVVVCSVFSPEEEGVVKRLNAACCAKVADLVEMHRRIGEAIACAFRMASSIPDAAWLKTMSLALSGNESA